MFRLLLIILISFVFGLKMQAESVSYTYKALAAEGCSMEYSVVKQGEDYYIIATVSSDRMHFLQEPTMKIRTFENEVLTITGEAIREQTQTGGMLIGSVMVPVTDYQSTAQFKVTKEELEAISFGISKIRLTMTPMNHERTFKRDKIGKKLYLFYLHLLWQDDNF